MNDHVEMYRDAIGEWRWRRVAENGRVIAESGEGYHNRSDCLEMAARVNGPEIEIRQE